MIPSFTSFPSQPPQPDSEVSASSPKRKSSGKDRKRSRERARDGDKSEKRRHRHKHKHKHHDRDYDFKEDERQEASSSSAAFFSDYKGNRAAAHGGGTDSIRVPKYSLIARGSYVMGLDHSLVVVRRNNQGIEIVPRSTKGRQKQMSLTDPKARHLLLQPPRPVSALPGISTRDAGEDGEDFLRLTGRPSRSKTRHRDKAPLSQHSTLAATIHAVDAEGSDGFTSDSGESSETSEEESNPETPVLTSKQMAIKKLEEKLREDPSSVQSWLSLLSHSISAIPLDTKNAAKVRAEIAESILSRATSAHPSNKTSITLRLKYLRAGEEVWDEKKLQYEWDDALALRSTEVWMAWLDWKFSRSRSGLEGIMEDAAHALEQLRHTETGSLRVQWRAAVVLQQAGFTERATALFQCQAELAFNVPRSLIGQPSEILLNSLEGFWESEHPRFGESGTKGWGDWVTSDNPEYASAPLSSSILVSSLSVSDPFQRWASEESDSDLRLTIPTRSTDEIDDPYSTVLFSDIRRLLIPLETIQAKRAFRLIWLSFLGLHIPGFSKALSDLSGENWDDRWCYTFLTRPGYLRTLFPEDVMTKRQLSDAQSGAIVGGERKFSKGFGPIKNWDYGIFDAHEGLVEANWARRDVEHVDEGFLRRIFQQCRVGGDDREWDSLAIAFENVLNNKSALKISQSFLSSDEQSIERWRVHAALERFRGKLNNARKVYNTVLISQGSQAGNLDAGDMWWSWAEMEWLAGQHEASLAVILKSVGVEGPLGVKILRAKRQLEDAIQRLSANSVPSKDRLDPGTDLKLTPWEPCSHRVAWIKSRALLELLTSSLPAALTVLDHHMERIDKSSVIGTRESESLMMVSLALIYHYGVTLRNPCPPEILRKRAEKALLLYPSNSFVLGMFLEGERGQGVWGKVREQLGEVIVDGEVRDKDLMRRVVDLWIESGWEHGRWQLEKERARSGLNNAVKHERTRGSPTLWRFLIELEVIDGNLTQAKSLFFLAIKECPLVKELYLLAFGPLRPVFGSRELMKVVEGMVERGLRLRKDMEEPMENVPSGSREGDDYGEEDIEYDAEELRRLRPY